MSSPRKKTDIRDCSACLWQSLLETEGRAEPAGSCDSWTACWDRSGGLVHEELAAPCPARSESRVPACSYLGADIHVHRSVLA